MVIQSISLTWYLYCFNLLVVKLWEEQINVKIYGHTQKKTSMILFIFP
jgi:hypothetical protein